MANIWTLEQRDEYLRQHRKGDQDSLAIDPEDAARLATSLEDPRLPALLPVFSAQAGVGVLWALVPDMKTGARFWKKQVWFAGAPWTNASNRVYWWLSYNEQWKRASLIVVVAPEVEVWTTLMNDESWVPSQYPRIEVFRASSAELVPALGSALQIHQIIGQEVLIVNGFDPADVDLSDTEQRTLQITPAVEAIIRPLRNRVLLRHTEGHWSLDMRMGRGWVPQGFVYEVLPVRKDANGVPLTTIRVLYTKNDVTLEVTRAEGYLQDILAATETVTRLSVQAQIVEPHLLPPQGTALGELNEYTAYRAVLSDRAVWWGKLFETVVGFTPVLGPVVDVAHLAYMSSAGQTFWGEQVGPEDIFVQGVFTLMGVFADGEDAARLVGMTGTVLPGAKIISTNPGLVASLKAFVLKSCDAYLLEVIEGLRKEQRKELIDALAQYIKDGDITKLMLLFEEHIGSAFRVAIETGALPERTIREALDEIHPADLPGFLNLDAAAQKTILDLMQKGAGKAVVDKLSGALSEEFNLALDVWKIERAFSRTWDSFAVQLLSTGYAKYRARGGQRNAIQWAVALRSNNRYYAELVRLMGPDFAEMLKRTEQYWEMPASAIQQFAGMKVDIGEYVELRKLASRIGRWIQIDHVLEQRFLRNHSLLINHVIDVDHIRSIAVPANAVVAKVLKDANVPYTYIHAEKTRRLAQLIPHGFEDQYTLSQIFDAHLLVMKYQLGLGPDVLNTVLLDEFVEVAWAVGQSRLASVFQRRMADPDWVIRKRLP